MNYVCDCKIERARLKPDVYWGCVKCLCEINTSKECAEYPKLSDGSKPPLWICYRKETHLADATFRNKLVTLIHLVKMKFQSGKKEVNQKENTTCAESHLKLPQSIRQLKRSTSCSVRSQAEALKLAFLVQEFKIHLNEQRLDKSVQKGTEPIQS